MRIEADTNRIGGGRAHTLRASAAVKAVVATQQGNDKTKDRCLDESGKHVLELEKLPSAIDVGRGVEAELVDRNDIAAEHADYVAHEHQDRQHKGAGESAAVRSDI